MPAALTTSAPLLVPILTAAQQLGISRSSVYRLLDAGTFETVSIGTRRLIVSESLRHYVDSLREAQAV
jgi:excisionase family DNA binding protein